MTTIPDTIYKWFQPWHGCKSWCCCNAEKQPEYRGTHNLCRWRKKPELSIMPFNELTYWCRFHEGFGFIAGEDNNHLAYFDFDDCLDSPDGNIINPQVGEFLDVLQTFTELSSGKKGLHAVVGLEPDIKIPEFTFKDSFCKGKYYPSRFLKVTGVPYRDYNMPIRIVTFPELSNIFHQIGTGFEKNTSMKVTNVVLLTNKDTWHTILSSAGVHHIPAPGYLGIRNYADGSSRTIVESYRIVCPNRNNHKTDRIGDYTAHLAILVKDSDGVTSIKCNHNSCDSRLHPNLLQKLWNQVRKNRDDHVRERLKKIGVNL